jgi:hypothetical protein
MAFPSFRPDRKRDVPTVYVGDHTDKLSRIKAVAHDPDERPRREDLTASPGADRFKIPVPVPNWLRPRRERTNR